MNSPLGPVSLSAHEHAITGLTIGQRASSTTPHPVLTQAMAELAEYFAGTRTQFVVPTDDTGTPFLEALRRTLQEIPFGHAMSYQELGLAAGVGTAPRAVGGAVGKNPIPIIIPCHRILASNQRITGYSGGEGIPTKVALLELEGISYR
jgi:methylated-DNA-[protein]-cysteine S-methyltransferase